MVCVRPGPAGSGCERVFVSNACPRCGRCRQVRARLGRTGDRGATAVEPLGVGPDRPARRRRPADGQAAWGTAWPRLAGRSSPAPFRPPWASWRPRGWPPGVRKQWPDPGTGHPPPSSPTTATAGSAGGPVMTRPRYPSRSRPRWTAQGAHAWCARSAPSNRAHRAPPCNHGEPPQRRRTVSPLPPAGGCQVIQRERPHTLPGMCQTRTRRPSGRSALLTGQQQPELDAIATGPAGRDVAVVAESA